MLSNSKSDLTGESRYPEKELSIFNQWLPAFAGKGGEGFIGRVHLCH